MGYSYCDILDGFIYWALKMEPDVSVAKAMEHYWAYLRSQEIDPMYDHYFKMFLSAESLRNSSQDYQEEVLRRIRQPAWYQKCAESR